MPYFCRRLLYRSRSSRHGAPAFLSPSFSPCSNLLGVLTPTFSPVSAKPSPCLHLPANTPLSGPSIAAAATSAGVSLTPLSAAHALCAPSPLSRLHSSASRGFRHFWRRVLLPICRHRACLPVPGAPSPRYIMADGYILVPFCSLETRLTLEIDSLSFTPPCTRARGQ